MVADLTSVGCMSFGFQALDFCGCGVAFGGLRV